MDFVMFRKKLAIILAAAAMASCLSFSQSKVLAQTSSATDIVLVLPFENVSNHPEYNWIGESFADSLSSLLNKPGMIVVTSDERAVAYPRLRLPLTVLPSRATAIKIAREAKASMIVIGTYNVTLPPADPKASAEKPPPANITGEAHVVRVNEGRMTGDIFDGQWAPRVYDFGGDLTDLQKMHGELAYQILVQRDKALSFSRNKLLQEATRNPPQAFEALQKCLMNAALDPSRAL